MWRKTVIKQISKNLPLTEEAYKAIAVDNEESSIEDYQKNSLLEQSKRPSEANIENLLPTNTTTGTESSETSKSVTTSNEQPNGSQQELDGSQEQDLNPSGVQESLPEKS